MKINDNIYNFSFQFIDYEFDTFTNESDIYDLNWLKCRYEFIFKGKHLSIDEASMTTFDVLNFISDIEYILVNNEYKKIELQNFEPDFLMFCLFKINSPSNGIINFILLKYNIADII